ncbi:ankyrin repeat and protein kinase domain-containing protein 1-like [Mytilus trossulus]|uniref:ankyrin repeat and protein kinase domain-containing protein 1-like n=1 Tax=Mytilus trossulus TaxID=6551 RepID=UPI0030069736
METNESLELRLLKKVIKDGNFSETKRYITQKTSLSSSGICEAFFETIKSKQQKIFEYFVEEVDLLNLRYSDEEGRRALHYAVEVGNLDMVRILMKHGAPLNYSDNKGYQAIHIATQNGDTEMLNFLISHGANVSSAKTLKEGYTPLHIAALCNQPQALEVLADGVGSLNVQTKRQCDCLTSLHLATKNEYVDIVKILCEKGACLDLANLDGRSPLHYAADRGNLEILKILLNHGASIKIKDSSRRSILQYAVFSKSPECVQLLIDKGADVNSADLSNHTPLVSAVTVGSADIVEILIKHGADVNVRPGHETPLLLAASSGNIDVARKLISAGANLKAVNRTRETVLHKCQKVQKEKRDQLMDLLVQSGAELNVVDAQGFTPLHTCAFQTALNNFALSTLKILVEAGAHLSIRESSGVASRHSPLCMLVWTGYFEAGKYLINSGWNLYPETWMYLPGKTPEQDQFHQWMRDICKEPPSLIRLCRASIRYHFISRCTLGCEMLSSISKLELPRTLKDYLMLKD